MKSTIVSRPFLLLFCAASLLYACKKDKDETPTPPKPKPVAERILGKWNIIKESEARYAYNTNAYLDSNSITIGTGEFTTEFRTDGKMYVYANDNGSISRDTLPYSFTADTTLVTINGDPYLFKQFTDSNMVTLDIYDDGTANVKHYLQFKK